ncbi:hydrolase [Streptomyces sp. NA04227]|uniref:HAD family acid phosphatase n=1 Tax=Streptomyces sp. NA04227 TaxID=2742136 RepID=UPI001590DD0D|nr:HAD family acid phosphatase [Streptomyces sp. NA04227]QKW07639.1 hydrolase [Streptomyces sp. NA04227]
MARFGVRRSAGAACAVAALGLGLTAQAAAPAAAAPAPQAVTAAATTGDVDYDTWKRDVATVTDQARTYLEQRTARTSGEKRAIVFDIDNTTLETEFHHWYEFPTPAVQGSLDLARYADSRGVDVFFVTARPGIIKSLTEHNLKSVGYPVDGLSVRDLGDLIFDEVSAYKTEEREKIEARGYTIIANVGNRATDLVGGHAERTFKLPDYDGKLS